MRRPWGSVILCEWSWQRLDRISIKIQRRFPARPAGRQRGVQGQQAGRQGKGAPVWVCFQSASDGAGALGAVAVRLAIHSAN